MTDKMIFFYEREERKNFQIKFQSKKFKLKCSTYLLDFLLKRSGEQL